MLDKKERKTQHTSNCFPPSEHDMPRNHGYCTLQPIIELNLYCTKTALAQRCRVME